MKYLIPLLAFLLIGCDGEKSNVAPSKDSPKEAASEAPSERSPEESATEAKPPKSVSVNPNLKYEIQGDAVTITDCDKKVSGELIIPANIEGKPVTKIGEAAFQDCTSLTSITIGDGVTTIGVGAFADCTSLTSITIPESVTSIGVSAFWKCTSLTSITIPDGVTSIGLHAFNGCTSLMTIEVSADNVNYTDIEGVLFNEEKNLLHSYPAGKSDANYVILAGVTTIGGGAFYNCTSLTSITIPDSVKTIGVYAFFQCTSLTSITIPDSVTSIGNETFSNCTGLTSITIPVGVTSIGFKTFFGCNSLTSIAIPNSVTSIGGHAFYGCTSLASITIPASVTNIGGQALDYCNALFSVTFLGDAPKVSFISSSPTIYREADAKGWGDTLAGRPVVEKGVDGLEKVDNAKLKKAIRKFVTAESPAELKKYIRNSERVGPLLDRYYERADYEAEGFEALDMSQMKYNGDVVTILVQKADFLSSPIAVERVVDGEKESYQIDWESWVGYCDYTPEQMRAEKPDKPFLMRVIVKPVNYYNYDFSDDVKWRSLGLELKDSIHSFLGYVKRDSEQDKKFRAMMKGGQAIACMVRVAYPTGSRSKDQVEILEIVGSGWLQNLKKDK